MRVVVLHNEPGEDATVDESDVLAQRDAVAAALAGLGHQTFCLSCTLDLDAARRRMTELQPDAVFNLVESLGGTDRLMALATLLLDALQLPYTGARTDAILATSNKLTAKARLCEAGLPTPAWLQTSAQTTVASRFAEESFVRGANNDRKWILKPVFEHASFGIDDRAVVTARDVSALEARLRARERRIGRPHFAEQFIEGRELNLSLLGEMGDSSNSCEASEPFRQVGSVPSMAQVLPPAEIDFSSFPPDKPQIVGHQAKWDQDSFEYQQTPRRFEFPATDRPLVERVSSLARSCWQLFGLSGYARVDFRVDGDGRPWILEVNANPCLSPDAGFAAAITQAGIRYDEAIQRILDDAVNGVRLLGRLETRLGQSSSASWNFS